MEDSSRPNLLRLWPPNRKGGCAIIATPTSDASIEATTALHTSRPWTCRGPHLIVLVECTWDVSKKPKCKLQKRPNRA